MKEPLPKISVIIPSFNMGDTIGNAIRSVVSQSYSNLEVIIVDGLSTDTTAAVVAKLAASDSRIRFVSEKDKGIYDAMNKGIKMAVGDWLYFLGCDDSLYNESVFVEIAANLQEHNPDLLYGDVILLPNRKRYGGSFSKDRILSYNISHQAIFYQRSVFKTVGLYNLRYFKHADWDLNIRCFMNKDIRISYTDTVISFFTLGGAGSGHDTVFLKEVLIPERIRQLQKKKRIIKNLRTYDEYWRMIRNARISKAELDAIEGQTEANNMYRLQSHISRKLLQTGICSKFFMFLSYCIFRFKNRKNSK